MKYTWKTFGFALGGKEYGDGFDKIDWGKGTATATPTPDEPKLDDCNICNDTGFIDADGAACHCRCLHGQKLTAEMKERARVRHGQPLPEIDLSKLLDAVRALYYSARWTSDRLLPADEQKLWEAVRDAAGFEPGKAP